MDYKGSWLIGGKNNKGGGDDCVGVISDNNDKTAQVVWNNGATETFDVNNTDIRVFDLGPPGICHNFVTCDTCASTPIIGIRWKCSVCYDFDLCSVCYHSDMHSCSHAFTRFDVPNTEPVPVGARQREQRIKIYSFFPGAVVKRGKDWEWGKQDGGVGNVGKVIKQYDWTGPFNKLSSNSGVSVLWNKQKSENNYRVGFQGKVDLTCVQPEFGGYCYKGHLPTLAKRFGTVPRRKEKKFNVGDMVTVTKSVATLQHLQDNHGGFLPDMVQCIGVIGNVIELCPSGDVVVLFDVDGRDDMFMLLFLKVKKRRRWVFNAEALKKVEKFEVNDKVKVIEDKHLFTLMQKNLQTYKNGLEELCGAEGIVVKPFNGESVHVNFADRLIVSLSVGAVNKIERDNDLTHDLLVHALIKGLAEIVNEQEDETTVEPSQPLQSITEEKGLVATVYNGNISAVKKILETKPHMINICKNGKTSLQIATLNQNIEMVKVLLDRGAHVNIEDNEGDTALHFAANLNFPEIGDLLLSCGANVNVRNKVGFTPLHIAAHKGYLSFAKVLVKYNSNIDIKDANGNSALHGACAKGNDAMVEILMDSCNKDLTVENAIGYNALQLAIVKGHTKIVTMIIDRIPEMIHIPRSDGFNPLHIAVINGMEDIVALLLSQKQDVEIDIEEQTHSKQTVLHIAAIEGFLSILKLLIEHGASVDAESRDGNTAIHLCVLKHMMLCNLPQQLQGWELYPDIATVKSHFANAQASGIVVACFLVENGASIDYNNFEGKTVLDICDDKTLKKLLIEFAKKNTAVNNVSTLEVVQTSLLAQREDSIESCPMCNAPTPIEGRFQPCGHALLCYDHAECMSKCPECKAAVKSITRVSVDRLPNCMICRDVRVNVTFQPCGHQIACYGCGKRFRVCLKCDVPIQTKVPIGDIPVEEEYPPFEAASGGNEESLCNICFERRRNSVFLCGHTACKQCAYALKECHMCRKPIDQIIPIYDN